MGGRDVEPAGLWYRSANQQPPALVDGDWSLSFQSLVLLLLFFVLVKVRVKIKQSPSSFILLHSHSSVATVSS